jgi:hypothetical protein
MRNEQANELRYAIENLINAKLCDALHRRDGFARLIAHRTSGVASADIRSAEQALEAALKRCLSSSKRLPVARASCPC